MSWNLKYETQTKRDLERIPAERQERIVQQLATLTLGPQNVRAEKLKGKSNHYKIRVGEYRIVFEVIKRERLARRQNASTTELLYSPVPLFAPAIARLLTWSSSPRRQRT